MMKQEKIYLVGGPKDGTAVPTSYNYSFVQGSVPSFSALLSDRRSGYMHPTILYRREKVFLPFPFLEIRIKMLGPPIARRKFNQRRQANLFLCLSNTR